MSYGEHHNENGLLDLIEALTILSKYGAPHSPTHCEHDIMQICIDPGLVSADDLERLEQLGVSAGEDGSESDGCFYSFRFGSA